MSIAVLTSALVDLGIVSVSFLGAYWLRFNLPFLPTRPVPIFYPYLRFAFFVGLVGLIFLYTSGVYHRRRLTLELDDVLRILKATLLSTSIVIIISYLFRGLVTRFDDELFSRLIIGLSWVLSVSLLIGWRLCAIKAAHLLSKNGWRMTRMLILGVNSTSVRFFHILSEKRDLGYQVVGFLYEGESPSWKEEEKLPILGHLGRLGEILRVEKIHEVVGVLDRPAPDMVVQLINTCERADVRFRLIPDLSSLLMAPVELQEVAGFPLFAPREQLLRRWNRYIKRTLDAVLALFFLLATLPVGLLICLAIKLTSQGAVFFMQERVGKNEKVFRIFKFRSMYVDAEERLAMMRKKMCQESDPIVRLPQDPRVTKVGRFLRRFSLDEFPQLLNVLKGEMSIVGPRPHIPSEVAEYKKWHRKKFDVLPGITGLTQVSGRKDLSLDDMIRLDIFYIENWSVWLDLKILLQTIPIVLNGRGAY